MNCNCSSTSGDPRLGGKLIDWAIVEDLLVPAVRRDLALSGFARRDNRWRANFAKLKLAAEDAKIELSRRDTYDIVLDLADGEGGTPLRVHPHPGRPRRPRPALLHPRDQALPGRPRGELPAARPHRPAPARRRGDPRPGFTVERSDGTGTGTGTRQRLAPDTLSITHAQVLPGDAVLTSTLGIGKADGSFAPMLRKGTALPASVTKTFETSIPLRRSQPDAVIRIPLLEGERRRADRNTRVGLLEIRPRDVRFDLPAQTPVEVTFEISATNREVTVTADIPVADAQFEAAIDRSQLVAPTHDELVDRLHDLEQRTHALRERAEEVHSEQALTQLDDLSDDKAFGHLRKEVDAAAVDTGAAGTSDRRIRDLEAQLDDVEEAIGIPGLQHELWDLLNNCEDLIEQTGGGPAERRELENLRTRATSAGEDGSPAGLRRLADRVRDFQVDLLRRSDQWDFLVFQSLVDLRDEMTSAPRPTPRSPTAAEPSPRATARPCPPSTSACAACCLRGSRRSGGSTGCRRAGEPHERPDGRARRRTAGVTGRMLARSGEPDGALRLLRERTGDVTHSLPRASISRTRVRLLGEVQDAL